MIKIILPISNLLLYLHIHELLLTLCKTFYFESFIEEILKEIYDITIIGFYCDSNDFKSISIIFWELFCDFEINLLKSNFYCKKVCLLIIPHLFNIIYNTGNPKRIDFDKEDKSLSDLYSCTCLRSFYLINPENVFNLILEYFNNNFFN